MTRTGILISVELEDDAALAGAFSTDDDPLSKLQQTSSLVLQSGLAEKKTGDTSTHMHPYIICQSSFKIPFRIIPSDSIELPPVQRFCSVSFEPPD